VMDLKCMSGFSVGNLQLFNGAAKLCCALDSDDPVRMLSDRNASEAKQKLRGETGLARSW